MLFLVWAEKGFLVFDLNILLPLTVKRLIKRKYRYLQNDNS
jgi:hypothetical protein